MKDDWVDRFKRENQLPDSCSNCKIVNHCFVLFMPKDWPANLLGSNRPPNLSNSSIQELIHHCKNTSEHDCTNNCEFLTSGFDSTIDVCFFQYVPISQWVEKIDKIKRCYKTDWEALK